MADYYYAHCDDPEEWGEPEPVETPARLDAVLSVRFTGKELDSVRAAAAQAGMKVTAFVRQAALEAISRRPVDRARLEQDLAQAAKAVRDAQQALAS